MADNSNIIKTITVNDVTCDVAAKYDVDGNAIKDTYVQKDGSNVTVDNLQINDSISIKNPVNESYTEFASHDGSKLTIGTTEASEVDIIGGTANGIRLKSDTVYLGDTVEVFEAHPDKVVKVGADSYILQLKSAEQPKWGDKTLAMKSDLSNYLSLSGGKMTGNINLNGKSIIGDYQANEGVNIIHLSSTAGLLVGNDKADPILIGPYRPRFRHTMSGIGETLEEIAFRSDIVDPSGNVISTTYLNKNTDGIMNGSLTVNNDTLFGHADGTSEHNFRGEIYTSYAINLNGGDVTLNGNDDNTRLTVNNNEVAHLSDLTERIPCTLAQASNNSYIINKAGLYVITLESVSGTPKNRLMTMLSVEDITLNVKTYYMPSMYDEYYVKYDSSTKQVTCSMNDKYSIVSIRFVVDYE